MIYILDIYVKVVIAVFGFIAPAVTLLMPIFSVKIATLRRRINEEQIVAENIRNSLQSEYDSILSVKNPKSALEKDLKTHNRKTYANFN